MKKWRVNWRRGSWRDVRNLRKERRGEREGDSSAGQSGNDSVDEKIRRLTERIDELEGKDKRRGGDRVVKGYSSESDESGDKWRWDGRAWWHKVECKGPMNSRLRAVSVALEQDSRKWKEGLTQLQDSLIGCKEADKARRGPVVLLGVRDRVF